MTKKAHMDNLLEKNWDELWNSFFVNKVKVCTKKSDRNCWMIDSISPTMQKYILFLAVG
jgi:hypothetical protein